MACASFTHPTLRLRIIPWRTNRMKNPTSSAAALVSLLSTAAGDASRCRSTPAFASFAATTAPSCPLSESCCRRRSSSGSSPFARSHPEVNRGWSRAGSRRRLRSPAVSCLASAAAGSGPMAAAVASVSGAVCGASRQKPRQRQQQRRWVGGGREQQRGWFARAAGLGRAGPPAGRSGVAAAAAAAVSFDGLEGIEEEEDRCIRRLDTAVRTHLARVFI